MPLAKILIGLVIGLSVVQCEHTIRAAQLAVWSAHLCDNCMQLILCVPIKDLIDLLKHTLQHNMGIASSFSVTCGCGHLSARVLVETAIPPLCSDAHTQ